MTVTTRFADTRDPIQLTLPDLAAHGISAPAVQDAIATYNRLAGELAAAQDEHQRLVDARSDVVQADRQALAKALAAGKPDPGTKGLEAHDRAVAAQARQVDALKLALATAADHVVSALEAERATILAAVDAQVADTSADLAAALEAWAEFRAQRSRLFAMGQWARDFPGRLRYPAAGGGRIAGLPGVNHDDYLAEAVIAALRQDAAYGAR
jgi:hypothetical protein